MKYKFLDFFSIEKFILKIGYYIIKLSHP